MEEIWKEIEGFEGLYSVSNYGRIKSIPHIIKYKGDSEYHVKGKMMKPHLANGYYQAILTVNGKRYHIVVHRLVAKAFIPNPDNKPEVNHIDGDKTNNSVQNLEWVTSSENCRHAFKIGLRETSYGNRKLSDEDVRYIKSEYENRKSRFWGKKKIAEKLGISLSAIDFIITGVTWGGV